MISLNDVKQAIEVTTGMTPYQKWRYFKKKGIHYGRAIRYIGMMEKFEHSFNTFKTKEEEVDEVIIHEYTDNNDNNEIGKYIAEAVHEIEQSKPKIKTNGNIDIVKSIGKHVLGVGFTFICIVFVNYIYQQSNGI